MEIKIEAKNLGIFIFSCIIENIKVKKDDKIEEELRKKEEEFSKENPEKLKENSIVKSYREFYWRIGIDPTKTRPSGEALRRRVSRKKSLPRINNIVDSGNIASLITLVPIGIYDLDKIKGNLKICLSKGNEEFFPIGGKKVEKIKEKIPIFKDEEKVLHLYPHRDSKLTCITNSTKRILIIGAGVQGIKKDIVKKSVEITKDLILKSCSEAKVTAFKYYE